MKFPYESGSVRIVFADNINHVMQQILGGDPNVFCNGAIRGP